MKELYYTFLKHLAMALGWGVIFIIIFFVASFGIKQQVKEAIQYTVRTSLGEATLIATDPFITGKIKQNIKEGIEFTTSTLKKQIKILLTDPEIKQDLKEAIEYSTTKIKK